MERNSLEQDDRCPFRLDQCGDLAPLRRAFEAAGISEPSIAETVLLDKSGKPMEFPALLRRTASPSPYNTLVRLFVLARAVPEDAARAALAPAPLEQILALGLLRRARDGIRAEAALMPFEDLLLARDFWSDFTGQPPPRDYVPGMSPATRTLAGSTVRRKGEMALDLGTGFGFQALLAARHAHRVVGTDINPRALNFAALNARLNGLSNIELRLGGLYEPVADARFDLIVANPPFVISPQAQYEYRDGGLPGDALSEQVIRGAPKLLSEGGYCTVLFNWHHPTQESWADRPTVWVGSSGCDAWIICTEMTDPIGYTATWLATEKGPDATRYERLFDEWLAYYERLGIRFISSGIMVLRRRAAPANWIRAEAAPPGEAPGSCSEQIQRIFAAEDLLQSLGEERNLLDQALLLTPGHRLEHDLQTEGGRWVVKAARLRQTQGLPFVGNVDQMVSRLLAGCDGRRTLRQLATDLAAALSVNFEQVAPSCLAVMRTLLKAGFLTAPGKLPDRT